MATIVLSAVGMAIGGSVGGAVLGLSSAVIGRAIGATLGQAIDQRIMGQGSDTVETGRIDRFRLTGASEGAAVSRVFGRMRIAGQVIWATRFREISATTTTGGKGSPRSTSTDFSYTVSLAIALCEGEITRIGRVWADGIEIAPDDVAFRVYTGSADQLPDPKIEAVEGAGMAPAYRGIAYVVVEDLDITRFGNRVPQFTFEVFRPSAPDAAPAVADIARQVRAVALIPGTGEYALATEPVNMASAYGHEVAINVNSPTGRPDLLVSLDALRDETPNCASVSLVVSWFGTDLRCGVCDIEPRVEQTATDGQGMPWRVSGLTRSAAQTVPMEGGRPIYGGTPTDQSVVQAIQALAARGMGAVFYPFILMEQITGNILPDPWTGQTGQPALPWRGRITTSLAPGVPGSPDQTALADAEVAAFFGTVQPGDFTVSGSTVTYTGPADWSYRRFILHYAYLCAAAGGVEAFCIGSELRGLTQIRGAGGSFPAVEALMQLASEVKAILGPDTQIGYAADWSEYHGYQPPGTGDKIFHLDPLWADPAVDFIGIDNYMPLSDWRDGDDHLDAGAGSIYDLDYLSGNVAGGEGFDWFYHSPEARAAQIRTPISDFWGEDWVWRTKDLRGWWQNPHHNRIGGTRDAVPTVWVPESKPIWFTEFGCAAIDKGTNEPNKFLDPKSSESGLPYGSNGMRDDLIQVQYLRAVMGHFDLAENNPVSVQFGHQMVDMTRAHVWAWDARPYPFFPGNLALWADGGNYARGHWLNGRSTSRTLASVVAEICAVAGVTDIDVSRLHGIVRGYGVDTVGSARAALQPLALAYGFDVMDRGGVLHFVSRGQDAVTALDPLLLAVNSETDSAGITLNRAPAAEVASRVQVSFIDAEADYETRSAEAIFADEATFAVSQTEFPLALTRSEGQRIAERWLAEGRLARETAQFSLPPSRSDLGPGALIRFDGAGPGGTYRIDRIDVAEARLADAVRMDRSVYLPQDTDDQGVSLRPFMPPAPVAALLLDLPLLTGDEVPQAPRIAASGVPWPGTVAVFGSASDSNYTLNTTLTRPATMGQTLTPLFKAQTGLWDSGAAVRVKLVRGALASVNPADVLAGANAAAIGDGTPDGWEVFQFANADLVAPDTYDLTLRLRGQAGTDALTPEDWPVGSYFVLLDGAVPQIDLPLSAVGQVRYLRYGPAARPYDDPTYRHVSAAFLGNGNRPLSPCHIRVRDLAGDHAFGWIRRTRIGGDSWTGIEVPLAEESEAYLIRIIAGAVVVRAVTVTVPEFSYAQWMRAADGVVGAYRFEVAQVSALYGAGPVASLIVRGL